MSVVRDGFGNQDGGGGEGVAIVSAHPSTEHHSATERPNDRPTQPRLHSIRPGKSSGPTNSIISSPPPPQQQQQQRQPYQQPPESSLHSPSRSRSIRPSSSPRSSRLDDTCRTLSVDGPFLSPLSPPRPPHPHSISRQPSPVAASPPPPGFRPDDSYYTSLSEHIHRLEQQQQQEQEGIQLGIDQDQSYHSHLHSHEDKHSELVFTRSSCTSTTPTSTSTTITTPIPTPTPTPIPTSTSTSTSTSILIPSGRGKQAESERAGQPIRQSSPVQPVGQDPALAMVMAAVAQASADAQAEADAAQVARHAQAAPLCRPTGKPAEKTSIACARCRAQKLKCQGGKPCARCVKQNVGHSCVYVADVRRRGISKKKKQAQRIREAETRNKEEEIPPPAPPPPEEEEEKDGDEVDEGEEAGDAKGKADKRQEHERLVQKVDRTGSSGIISQAEDSSYPSEESLLSLTTSGSIPQMMDLSTTDVHNSHSSSLQAHLAAAVVEDDAFSFDYVHGSLDHYPDPNPHLHSHPHPDHPSHLDPLGQGGPGPSTMSHLQSTSNGPVELGLGMDIALGMDLGIGMGVGVGMGMGMGMSMGMNMGLGLGKPNRTSIACHRCRRQKLKCLGVVGEPCPRCKKQGVGDTCTYMAHIRRRGKSGSKRSMEEIESMIPEPVKKPKRRRRQRPKSQLLISDLLDDGEEDEHTEIDEVDGEHHHHHHHHHLLEQGSENDEQGPLEGEVVVVSDSNQLDIQLLAQVQAQAQAQAEAAEQDDLYHHHYHPHHHHHDPQTDIYTDEQTDPQDDDPHGHQQPLLRPSTVDTEFSDQLLKHQHYFESHHDHHHEHDQEHGHEDEDEDEHVHTNSNSIVRSGTDDEDGTHAIPVDGPPSDSHHLRLPSSDTHLPSHKQHDHSHHDDGHLNDPQAFGHPSPSIGFENEQLSLPLPLPFNIPLPNTSSYDAFFASTRPGPEDDEDGEI
ncbi:Zn(2)-C6 fungal-type DNA-binding domain [Phaffia rhodozyma]|uniref:Zn(2)-C6 fungal-type DNA-binding domain n=1 Tax=Phaffia rhodozyma TaxID=264483 RepID=A0A0F7SRP9_PHARH|nr:Zn(2)-C6 fungal-type DNA-binding domain [Phaffia rhodozyma]